MDFQHRFLFYKLRKFNHFLQSIKKMGRKILKKGENPNQIHTEIYDRITKIEAEVLQRIQKLKVNNKSFLCQHFNMNSPQCQPFNPNVNYYDRFWKRFLLNEIGKQNVLQFRQQLDNFQKRLDKIEHLFEERQKQLQPLQVNRRKSYKVKESEKYFCEVCSKGYASKQSLILHVKVKHGNNEEKMQSKKQIYEQQIYQEDEEQ